MREMDGTSAGDTDGTQVCFNFYIQYISNYVLYHASIEDWFLRQELYGYDHKALTTS